MHRSSPADRTRVRPATGAVLAALLLAACSSAPSVTEPPGVPGSSVSPTASMSTAGSSSSEATNAPSPARSAEPSIGPTAEASAPAPTAAAIGGWTAVLPPLTSPAAYLDLGFAGNGNLLVVGTDDLAKSPAAGLWIARYTPDGNRISKVAVGRAMQAYPGRSMVHVDPTDDTVLFTQIDVSTGYYHLYRVASETGKVLANLTLHRAMTTVANTPDGRIFGISATYGGWTNKRPCIVDRLSSTGGIASGVDYWLEKCEVLARPTPPAYFQNPMSIDVGADGNLLILDWGEADFRFHHEPSGLGFTVLTPGFTFVRHFHLPGAWQIDDALMGLPAQGTVLAADRRGRMYIDQQVMNADMTAQLGARLGVLDRSGSLLGTWGEGGDLAGLTWPTTVRVDPDDRLWVVDLDPVANTYTVMRLDGPVP